MGPALAALTEKHGSLCSNCTPARTVTLRLAGTGSVCWRRLRSFLVIHDFYEAVACSASSERPSRNIRARQPNLGGQLVKFFAPPGGMRRSILEACAMAAISASSGMPATHQHAHRAVENIPIRCPAGYFGSQLAARRIVDQIRALLVCTHRSRITSRFAEK